MINKDNLIVGGRQNGCIAAWDLSEPNIIHKKYIIEKNSFYLRYPTYMTDCQWDNNHLYPIIALHCISDDEFCSVDSFGIINGWSIIELSQQMQPQILSDSSIIDLGCRDNETVKIIHEFKFDFNSTSNIQFGSKNSIQCVSANNCISVDPYDDDKMLFAYKSSIYMLDRVGSNVEIDAEYSLKYDVAGIKYPNNNAVSVAFCPWMKNIFVAGYENGMICLYNVSDSNPMRRLYDLNNLSCVLSVSWMKSSNDENGEDIMLYCLFKNGKIRFWDFKVNQETQNVVFEKVLPTNNNAKRRIINSACCKAMNSLIAMSNANGSHQFSVHRISA